MKKFPGAPRRPLLQCFYTVRRKTKPCLKKLGAARPEQIYKKSHQKKFALRAASSQALKFLATKIKHRCLMSPGTPITARGAPNSRLIGKMDANYPRFLADHRKLRDLQRLANQQ